MRHLRIFIQIMCLVLSWGASASIGEEFCKTYLDIQKMSHQKVSLKESLKLAFFPSSIIHPVELKQSEERDQSIQGNKYIFIHLPAPKFDLNKVQEIKSREKEIGALELFTQLKSAREMDACLTIIEENKDDFSKVQGYFTLYLNHQDQIEAYHESKSLEVLSKKLKTFQRQGWIVSYVNQMSEMYQQLRADARVSDILLVAHSDQFGRLYDAKKNIFPKGAFANLPQSVKKLIIYSCHSEKVISYYKINSYLHKFNYYYPQVESAFNHLFESKTPLLSIRAFKNISSRKSFTSSQKRANCQIEFDQNKNLNGLGVSLNDQFLGFVDIKSSRRLSFDCELLSPEKNQFKFYDVDKTERPSLGDWAVILRVENGKLKELKLKEYLTWDQKKHLLTIGQ